MWPARLPSTLLRPMRNLSLLQAPLRHSLLLPSKNPTNAAAAATTSSSPTTWAGGAATAGSGNGSIGGGGRPVELLTRASRAEERESHGCSSGSPPYYSVEIRCPEQVADDFSEALLCFGASSVSIEEPSSRDGDDMICLSSVFINGQDVGKCVSIAADSIGLTETPHYESRAGEQYDWIKNAEENFYPIEITSGLWIVPQWRSPPDNEATNIILNPGMAFGTGEHSTTKLCLLLLHGQIKGGESIMDYGTGSGILGIAALKMGASLSVGVDVDPLAIASAQQNVALNEICPDQMHLYLVEDELTSPQDGKIHVREPESSKLELQSRKGKFDFVLANILLNPLIELAEEIVSYGKHGAVIGVSGILSEQVLKVRNCYSKYLEGISVSEMDGWACLSGTKKFKDS